MFFVLFFNKSTTKQVTSINGSAIIPDISQPNRLKVIFPIYIDLFGSQVFLFENQGNYDVWAVDYNKYSLVYGCRDYKIAHTESVWILAREKQLDEETLKMLYDKLREANVDPSQFKTDPQSCDNN